MAVLTAEGGQQGDAQGAIISNELIHAGIVDASGCPKAAFIEAHAALA